MTKPNTIPEKFITDTRKEPKYWEEVQKETSKHSVEVNSNFYVYLQDAIKWHNIPFSEISRDLRISPKEFCGWHNGEQPKEIGELMRASSFILSVKPECFKFANSERFLDSFNYSDIIKIATEVTESAVKTQLEAEEKVLQSWFNRSKIARV